MSENSRDHIIEVTTQLIEQYNGDTKSITARMIAEKAGVGLGLINYHFKSKDKLITECVQRIIQKVVTGFHMDHEFTSTKERLTAVATYVFDFLFEHSAISRISILDDLENYTKSCNSVYTQRGFMNSLKGDFPEENKPLLVFILTSAIQTAFLADAAINELLGYDFTKPEDRAGYIKKLVDVLFEGMVKTDE